MHATQAKQLFQISPFSKKKTSNLNVNMNKSSSSVSSSSPPFTTLPPPPITTATNARLAPSVIPFEYDYRIMSPSSLSHLRQTAANNATRLSRPRTAASSQRASHDADFSNEYSSLFGEPVPTPTLAASEPSEYLSGSAIRTRTSIQLNSGSSEEETGFGRTVTLDKPGRLFSNVPYTSLLRRRSSTDSFGNNFDVLPTPLPRLQPPDIQILPNSSGGSSSEQHESPNFALLNPQNMPHEPDLYGLQEPADVTELSETVTIHDTSGVREYTEATRRLSNIGHNDSFDSPTFNSETPLLKHLGRQFSNDSYTSADWFRSSMHDFPEFTKMPKLRPSSKNVMSIKSDEMPTQHSPVAAMINDSNGSSSGGEERLLNVTQTLNEPTVPLDILTPRRPLDTSKALITNQDPASQRSTPHRRRSSMGSTGTIFSPSPPAAPPPPVPPEPDLLSTANSPDKTRSMQREMSPVIIRDSIVTGGDYRIDHIRLHKKTSFTILTDRSPQSSRAQTPTMQTPKVLQTHVEAPSTAPSSAYSVKQPIPQPRQYQSQQQHLRRKSLTSMHLRLPQLTPTQFASSDSPRPSVQFDMSGRYSPNKMPQKSILHHRESLSSSQDTTQPAQETPTPPPVPMRRGSLITAATTYDDQRQMRSYETLPLITDPYRTAIPRLHRSSLDIRRESAVIPPGALPRPLRHNPNPTRTQRGLLRVINSAESLSRIPQSNWTTSMDDLTLARRPSLTTLSMQTRRRSSSTSPSRRSSTQTASDRRSSNLSSVTTSDFSFRRPSLTQIPTFSRERRKSIFPGTSTTTSTTTTTTTPKRRKSIVGAGHNKQKRATRTKIAKPTTLSPIIGTPNKDSSAPHSPTLFMNKDSLFNASDTLSDTNSRRESISRIPIRSGSNSRPDSRLSQNAEPRVPSRMSSPLKEFTAQLPLSGVTSRTDSRSPSRTTVRSESRGGSRTDSRAAPSRSTSRASTRPISRGALSRGGSRPTSRLEDAKLSLDSRPNSRLEQARDVANSRSNSRLSLRSRSPIGRVTSVSPNVGRRQREKAPPGRRKSVSLSPKFNRKSAASKRTQSPKQKKRGTAGGKILERRGSRSRIPTRAKSDLSGRTSHSPSKSKPATELKRTASARKTATTPLRKNEPTSAKKVPASIRKPDSSVKRATSSGSKSTAAATKKQPTAMKREVTNLQKKATSKPSRMTASDAKAATKREASSKDLKRKTVTDVKQLKKQTPVKQLGKKADAKGTPAKTTTANNSKSSGVGGGVGSSNGGAVADNKAVETEELSAATIAATATATGALVSGLKRQPSTMSLLRMGSRLSLLSKKRPDSSLSRHITEETEENSDPNGQATTAAAAHLQKVGSSGQLVTSDGLPAVILEKSQKTLQNVQKTVTTATDEIHRTIHENLTDLKSLEQDVGRISDGAASSPTPSVATVLENRLGGSRSGTAGTDDKSPQPPTQPIEAAVSVLNANEHVAERVSASTAISVLPDVDCESANFQNFELGIEDQQAGIGSVSQAVDTGGTSGALTDEPSTSSGLDGIAKQRRSPDGQGGSTAGSGGKRTGSRELLEDPDEIPPKGCCRCCTRLCMPCRRARCSRCCRRGKGKTKNDADNAEERPVLSATSSTTTTNLEVIDETAVKNGCWQRMNCFKKKTKKDTNEIDEQQSEQQQQSETMAAQQGPMSAASTTTATTPKQAKCGACLRKIFCCRSANKIETTKSDDTDLEKGKCCACLPSFKKKTTTPAAADAWQDPEQAIAPTNAEAVSSTAATPAPADGEIRDGCCKRFWRRICCCCCRKKAPPVPAGSRRASIKPPPVEDTRRKLHVDLVEYTSQMKAAIPVLPLFLAWFCFICNIIVPGLGTLFAGIFCICVGIPRFSQYDSAKARFGSFVINTIVAASQLFCVLFCFVGWGWSIWWGTIMLKCARKQKKIRKVERLEMEEEQRQAAAASAAARAAANQPEPARDVAKA